MRIRSWMHTDATLSPRFCTKKGILTPTIGSSSRPHTDLASRRSKRRPSSISTPTSPQDRTASVGVDLVVAASEAAGLAAAASEGAGSAVEDLVAGAAADLVPVADLEFDRG